jgi:MFS transporter, AAHS family, benzoate transport protein
MSAPARTSPGLVIAICFAVVIVDGYDLVVYGAVAPSLLEYAPWGLTAGDVGLIGSLALAGMLVGAVTSGWLGDRFGRRTVLIATFAEFSVCTALCAIAPNPEVFGLLRFLAGLGLGGVLPLAIAIAMEAVPAERGQFANAVTTVANPIGGVVVSLVAILVIPALGFRALFWIGAVPALVIIPMALRYLPKSQPVRETADRNRSLQTLFSPTFRRATILFPLISFSGLLLAYGMNTWLPGIMRRQGYGIGSSISFLLVLNAGAVVGALIVSRLADRMGPRPTIATSFGLAVVCMIALALHPEGALLYLFVIGAGFGAMGTQILVNGFVGGYYPAHARATGLGWSLGLGRIGGILGPLVGGWILGSSIGIEWNFYVFAIAAFVAGGLILLVPRAPAPATETATVLEKS